MSHETKPPDAKWNGRRCSFKSEAGGPLAGKTLVGIVESGRYIGKTERGQIPTWLLQVRGASGKLIEVNLVEQYASFSE